MKQRRKHPVLMILAGILAVLIAVGCVFSHYGGLGTGESADQKEFAAYASDVKDLHIPEGTRIAALGEATHGTQEFQKLKQEVLEVLVEKYDIRSFGLEADYGCSEYVNRYIHGGEGSAEEAAAALGFAIYRTKEMEELIEWMRAYNETALPGEDIVFYGFDMQRTEYSYCYLVGAMEHMGLNTDRLKEAWDTDTEGFKADLTAEEKQELFRSVKEVLAGTKADPEETAQAIHLADVLLQNAELSEVINSPDGNAVRDRMMKDNVMWILEQEEARGNECIYITGHNGHMKQSGAFGPDQKVLGSLLADEIGKDSYYAVGTDFFKASVNLPTSSGKRITHTFYSRDPLAKAGKACGYEICLLDMESIPVNSVLKTTVDGYVWMGTIGEYYDPVLMRLLPMSYRLWQCPSELFDAVIFVSEGHPTVIKN